MLSLFLVVVILLLLFKDVSITSLLGASASGCRKWESHVVMITLMIIKQQHVEQNWA